MSAPSATRIAALKFFDVLRLMADDEELTPEVMLHIVGLTGALLVQYSDVPREAIMKVINDTARDPIALEGLYLAVRAAGLTMKGVREPEPGPEPDPEPDPAA